MPSWIHDRAKYILSKNPNMPESEAWAIATQQSHALGKTPKSYGTAKGKAKAKKKYDEPKKDYVQTAKPKTAAISLESFSDELEKIAIDMTSSMIGTLIGAAAGGTAGYLYAKKHNQDKVPAVTVGMSLGAQLGRLGGEALQDNRRVSTLIDNYAKAANEGLPIEQHITRDKVKAMLRSAGKI